MDHSIHNSKGVIGSYHDIKKKASMRNYVQNVNRVNLRLTQEEYEKPWLSTFKKYMSGLEFIDSGNQNCQNIICKLNSDFCITSLTHVELEKPGKRDLESDKSD